MIKRMHAIVEGRVQGVFFRDVVRAQAERLQVTGWVRNLADDTVEVLAEGADIAIAQLVCMLEQGSPRARVDEVRATYDTAHGEFIDFRVLP